MEVGLAPCLGEGFSSSLVQYTYDILRALRLICACVDGDVDGS